MKSSEKYVEEVVGRPAHGIPMSMDASAAIEAVSKEQEDAKEKSVEDQNIAYELGQISGLKQAAGILMNHAVEYFKLDKDEHANMFRSMAETLEATVVTARVARDKKRLAEVEEA